MTFSWVARALSGLPFSLTNNLIDVDRNGTLFDPLAPGNYTGAGTIADDNYTVDDYDGKRNGATGPGFFQLDTRFGWRLNVGKRPDARSVGGRLQPDQSGQLRQPERQSGRAEHVPRALGAPRRRRAAHAADRRSLRVLDDRDSTDSGCRSAPAQVNQPNSTVAGGRVRHPLAASTTQSVVSQCESRENANEIHRKPRGSAERQSRIQDSEIRRYGFSDLKRQDTEVQQGKREEEGVPAARSGPLFTFRRRYVSSHRTSARLEQDDLALPPSAPIRFRYKRAFLLGLACVVITTAIQLLSPWVLKNAIDDLNRGVTREKLALYAGLLLAIAIVGGVFRFLMRRILIGASRDIEYDMRNAFFARLQQMPLAYYQARRTGDLMSRATNDLNAVRTMIGPAIMYSSNTIIVFVVAIILMASIDTRLTLIALLPLPLVSISVKYFGSAIHTRFEAIQAQLADMSAVVQEALSGVRVVRAYNQEPHELERFRAANAEYVRRNRVLIRLQGMFYPSMTLFLGFGSLLVLWMGSREAMRGPDLGRRVRRFQRLSRDAELADDRVWLGHQHPAAWHGVVEADARRARRRAGARRSRCHRRRPCAR